MKNVTRSSGFTLMELLVVMAIMAVLAAFLFPVLSKTRESSRRSHCTANVRQLSQAFLLYVQDYDGTTPGGAYTRFADPLTGRSIDGRRYTVLWGLLAYLRTERIFVCPSQLGWDFSTTDPALDTHRPRQGSYASNYMMMGLPESMIDPVSEMILFADAYTPWIDCYANCNGCTGGCSSFIWDRIGRGYYQGDRAKPTAWHHGGVSLAFADGHVKWAPLGRIFYRNWVLHLPETDPHYHHPITQDW
jgi:prepilin-type N-terminal cleavage/methylation domain-containing protein/prepilin-type processing-associated H-X9-DG protein